MSSPSATVVSASGKVLIAGGYLVLDPQYSGVVISTSSRFYTVVQSSSGKAGIITVKSPQFKDAVWDYEVSIEGDGVRVTQGEGASKNKFVYIALQQTLRLILEIKGASHLKEALNSGLNVIIVGGNDFYSQRAKIAELGLEPLVSSLSQIPPFAYTGVTLADVHKTGLGSSAALITSLVSGLLLHTSSIPASSLDSLDSPGRNLAHNVSQFVHCLAQGKVGSGFDVAAAVYGSQLYTRFDPAVIKELMADASAEGKLPLLPTLSPENAKWDHKVVPFQLPPCTRLMLADVDAGSDTPSLVGKVLKWKESKGEEAKAFWDNLAASNNALAVTLLHLSTLHTKEAIKYTSALIRLSNLPPFQWMLEKTDVGKAFQDAHKISQDIRSKMRTMGEEAGVPIEPPEQMALLDACIKLTGVVGGGVPGAGGYDAIWVLVLDPPGGPDAEKPLHRVERLWARWKDLVVTPLSATESFEKGIRLEKLDEIPGLKQGVFST